MTRKRGTLNPRANTILHFVHDFTARHKHPPSIREIGEAAKISSTSVVNYYLDKLGADGLITLTPKISRSCKLTTLGLYKIGKEATCTKCHLQIGDVGYARHISTMGEGHDYHLSCLVAEFSDEINAEISEHKERAKDYGRKLGQSKIKSSTRMPVGA